MSAKFPSNHVAVGPAIRVPGTDGSPHDRTGRFAYVKVCARERTPLARRWNGCACPVIGWRVSTGSWQSRRYRSCDVRCVLYWYV